MQVEVSAAKIGQLCRYVMAELKSDMLTQFTTAPPDSLSDSMSGERESNQVQRIHFPCYFFQLSSIKKERKEKEIRTRTERSK